jgi:hypothetical protein
MRLKEGEFFFILCTVFVDVEEEFAEIRNRTKTIGFYFDNLKIE